MQMRAVERLFDQQTLIILHVERAPYYHTVLLPAGGTGELLATFVFAPLIDTHSLQSNLHCSEREQR